MIGAQTVVRAGNGTPRVLHDVLRVSKRNQRFLHKEIPQILGFIFAMLVSAVIYFLKVTKKEKERVKPIRL